MTEYVRPLKLEELNTNGLTDDERRKLSQVLARNRQVATHENSRLNRLNREIRTDFSKYAEKEQTLPSEKCLVCSRDIANDFGGCEKCGKHVCKKCCLAYGNSDDVYLCKPCYKHMLLEAKAAKWFYDNQKEAENKQANNNDSRSASNKNTSQSNRSSKYEYRSKDDEGGETMDMPTVMSAEHSAPPMSGIDTDKCDQMVAKMVEYNDELNKGRKSSVPKRSTPSKDNYLGKDAIRATTVGGTKTETVKMDKQDQKKCDEFVAKLVSLSREIKGKK